MCPLGYSFVAFFDPVALIFNQFGPKSTGMTCEPTIVDNLL